VGPGQGRRAGALIASLSSELAAEPGVRVVQASPGGHVDADEDPVQAVLREVAEETGITGQGPPFTICVQDIPGDARTGPQQHIDMVYVLRPVSGQATPQDGGSSRLRLAP